MSAEQVSAQIADRFTPAVVPAGPGWVEIETVLSGAGTDHVGALLCAQRRAGRAASEAAKGSLVVLEYTRLLAWPVLAAALRDRSRLDHDPSNVAIRPGELTSGRLAFHRGPAPACAVSGSDGVAGIVDELVERHLARLVGDRRRHQQLINPEGCGLLLGHQRGLQLGR